MATDSCDSVRGLRAASGSRALDRDRDEWSQIAVSAATEALSAIRELERRVDALEDAARPSRIDPDFEARVIAALERRSSSTRPPQDSLEVKTPGGTRVRGNLPLVIVVSIAVLITAMILRAEQLRDLIKALR